MDPATAADIVWLDGLITNPDRTAQNPNLLVWHGRTWLIDHGAALYIHHTWREPEAHARRPFERLADHVLLPVAGSLVEADARLAGRLDRRGHRGDRRGHPGRVAARPDPVAGDADAQRRLYVEYLTRRLASPRPFLEEAERARAAA